MTTKLDRPKVVHVYRSQTGSLFATFDKMTAFPNVTQELGEYVPRGPVVREYWEVRTKRADGSVSSVYLCSSERSAREESKELHFARRVAGFKKTKHYIVHITTRKVCR